MLIMTLYLSPITDSLKMTLHRELEQVKWSGKCSLEIVQLWSENFYAIPAVLSNQETTYFQNKKVEYS